MLCTKMTICPRAVRLITNCTRYHAILQKENHSSLVCTYLSKNEWKTSGGSNISNSISYNHKLSISSSCCLHEQPKPIEIPYAPPPVEPESDIFGSLGGRKYEKVELDADEYKEEERLKTLGGRVPRKFKPSPGQYATMIKTALGKGDIESAEKVFELCKFNRDKPTDYMYTLLMRFYAMQGDVKTCYKYFAEMKSKRMKIKANTYTTLFNACANAPDSTKALEYLKRVKDYMDEHECPMNQAHYNVMVKAYGRHQQLGEANKLVDEMLSRKIKIGISTLNSLMYAANSNIESGLKYVLRVWQLMRRQKIPPDVFTYHLLLRAIRDTHFGNCTVNDLMLPDKDNPSIIVHENRPDLLMYPPIISDLPFENVQRKNSTEAVALLEAPKFTSNDSTAISKVESEEERNPLPASIANLDLDAVLKQNKLILFGGLEELLKKMKNDRVEPNHKTMTFLVDLVPDSVAAEDALIKYAFTNRVPLDLDFYNMLIKKRSMRGAKKDAMAVLDAIHQADLRPNIVTYGVLGLSCRTSNECRGLMKAMKSTGHVINKYVADTLLNTAKTLRDFGFVLELMEKMKEEKIRLDDQTFEKLDEFQKSMSDLVKRKHPSTQKDNFKIGFSKFNLRYKSWQEDMGRKIVVERESKKK